jgi:ABC-type polar amino acid transport system ATPase subunit
MSDMLQLQGVTKHYNVGKPNEIRVLNGVDLTVKKGEVVALVAPLGRENRRFCTSLGCWILRVRALCISTARM